jgi:uncharacterized protein YacL
VLLSITYAISYEGSSLESLAYGALTGLVLGSAVLGIDRFLQNWPARSVITSLAGLIAGCLIGMMGASISQTFFNQFVMPSNSFLNEMAPTAIFLCCSYLGMFIIIRALESAYDLFPFSKNSQMQKRELLLDGSALNDNRTVELATTGLLDHQLVVPRFVLKDLSYLLENGDEAQKAKSRRSFENLRKLESIPSLGLRYEERDFEEITDNNLKLLHLANELEASIFTVEGTRIQNSSHEHVRFISIPTLTSILKPITQTGEFLNIKIQRYGKEPRQGVGYLEDGTMVVVNGGAEFIGETIKSQVLSVKHTASGRMIFCNALEEGMMGSLSQTVADMENTHKNYFAL